MNVLKFSSELKMIAENYPQVRDWNNTPEERKEAALGFLPPQTRTDDYNAYIQLIILKKELHFESWEKMKQYLKAKRNPPEKSYQFRVINKIDADIPRIENMEQLEQGFNGEFIINDKDTTIDYKVNKNGSK